MAATSTSRTPVHTNRLAKETSPYLLQHQHNPVDWYPWGDEAFQVARAQNKPIFLSVGYSTCYWCHVMERQSFEVEAIAAEMNQRFINIKVDREERPDVDQLYMTAVQVLTHHGGWPMSVFLLPDLRPFYGGTYFPPTDMHGRPGFVTLLKAIEDAYKNRRDEVEKSAAQLLNILQQLAEPVAPDRALEVNEQFIETLIDRSVSDYDPQHGGFGSAPKFPRETLLELLLIHNRSYPNARRMKMLRHTLDALAFGGIRDQLGGGFHRYSTDAQWLVPHFEIMLYDNAMLAWVYVEASDQYDEPYYAEIARGVFDFVLREMTSPAGAFYTAFDAEVDAMEGQSYLWTPREVEQVLGTKDAGVFNRAYGLDRGPNFADPHHGTGTPDKNILFLPAPIQQSGIDPADLAAMRQKLYDARSVRKQPLLDTKILTSWSALMIRAFAHGGKVLGEPRYTDATIRAAEYLLREHRMPDGALYRSSRDGIKKHAAFLDDYAALAQALLAIGQATGESRWRNEAEKLAQAMAARFADPEAGGFYFTDKDATDLIVRQKTASDSPLPSGNAIAVMVLLELGQTQQARQTLGVFAGQLEQQGEAMSSMIEAAALLLQKEGPFIVSAATDVDQADRPLSPQQLAAGIVTMRADWLEETLLAVRLSILSGFHINTHEAAKGLLATQLSVASDDARVAQIDYPPGELQTLAFSEEPIRVYSGEIAIAIRFNGPPGKPIKVAVNYQACDENACLPPVTKQIDVPPRV